jgi:hypothetical protein
MVINVKSKICPIDTSFLREQLVLKEVQKKARCDSGNELASMKHSALEPQGQR